MLSLEVGNINVLVLCARGARGANLDALLLVRSSRLDVRTPSSKLSGLPLAVHCGQSEQGMLISKASEATAAISANTFLRTACA